MSDAVIYDRGYRAYDGELGGRAATRRAVMGDGIRRILGLRRKARRKVLPWGLLALSVLMASIVIGLHFVAGSIDEAVREGLPQYAELFDLYSRLGLLLIAITGPELLAPDRSQGVLSVYFSRPMTIGDYLSGKLGAYVTVTGLLYVVPQIGLHIGLASINGDGFVAYLTDNLDVLWKVPAVAAAFIVVHGGILAVLSAHIDRTGFAAAAFLGTIIAGTNLASAISDASFAGARWFSLLAFDDHPRYVRDWLFDADLGTYAPERVGFDPWVSLITIVVIGLGGAMWMVRRYRRLA